MTTPAIDGGETLLADGFAAAERLRLENQHHFDVLSRYSIAHEYRDGGKEHCYTVDTVIRLDKDGNVETVITNQLTHTSYLPQIRFNPYDRAPMKPSLDYTFEQFYAAYAHMARLLAHPAGQMCVSLQAGECLFVDNHRVLHGRRAFTLAPGSARTMLGCYLTRDSVESQARVHNVW
jgi:alpha-ketoglutarate-dependent taurine dioxygenase